MQITMQLIAVNYGHSDIPHKNTYTLNVIVLEDNMLFVQTEFLLY